MRTCEELLGLAVGQATLPVGPVAVVETFGDVHTAPDEINVFHDGTCALPKMFETLLMQQLSCGASIFLYAQRNAS